eukprot:6796420-Pyramimonas_sp.AAC.1
MENDMITVGIDGDHMSGAKSILLRAVLTTHVNVAEKMKTPLGEYRDQLGKMLASVRKGGFLEDDVSSITCVVTIGNAANVPCADLQSAVGAGHRPEAHAGWRPICDPVITAAIDLSHNAAAKALLARDVAARLEAIEAAKKAAAEGDTLADSMADAALLDSMAARYELFKTCLAPLRLAKGDPALH